MVGSIGSSSSDALTPARPAAPSEQALPVEDLGTRIYVNLAFPEKAAEVAPRWPLRVAIASPLRASQRRGGRVRKTVRTRWPSGIHRGSLAPSGRSVILRASPPSSGMTWSCGADPPGGGDAAADTAADDWRATTTSIVRSPFDAAEPTLTTQPGTSVTAPVALMGLATMGAGMPSDGSMVYLSPAPLYHAAPMGWGTCVHRLGGTVVVMEKFEPEFALEVIEKYRVTDSQWVPTHFVRMLKLPEEVRTRYDLSSHHRAIHAAAPCPVPVKQAMIDWWGPVIIEYYAGSEGIGMTLLGSEQWLTHPGSVGPAIYGKLHICGPDGEEVPAGQDGLIYFENEILPTYHNDPKKTADAMHPNGWMTLGDIGHLDEDGYLYLTDRKSHMIISGGVNIYPQEIENLLVTHDKVMDAAVIGAPCPDLGEKVVAVVQPMDMADAGEALEEELREFLDGQLSRVKMPRLFDFRPELPREANGKLYKRELRDEYAARAGEDA